MAWYFKAFALTGRQVCDRNNPGRCPGLGASALSGRVGTWWCSDVWGVWGQDGVLMPGACGDMMVFWYLRRVGTWWCSDVWAVWGLLAKLECILMHASVCRRIFKWLNQLTQVAQSAYSSGSISLLKWLNQTTQVAQSASTAVCVTQFSHILNPMQPSA
mgnify:FL=1